MLAPAVRTRSSRWGTWRQGARRVNETHQVLLSALSRGVGFAPDYLRQIADSLVAAAAIPQAVVVAEFSPLDDEDPRLRLAERPAIQSVAGLLARNEPVSFETRLRFAATLFAHLEATAPRVAVEPAPLTPLEQRYLARQVRLYSPVQLYASAQVGRMARVRAVIRPGTRQREAAARRGRPGAGCAHGPPSRSSRPARAGSDDDPAPESLVGRLLRALARLVREGLP